MRRLLLLLSALVATPALAQQADVRPLRVVPAPVASEAEALRGVEVFLINEGATPLDADGPREIEVTATDGTRIILQRMPMARATVAPGSFVKARYVPVGLAGVALPPGAQHSAAIIPEPGETTVSSSTGSSSAFVDRFEPHEPIYGAAGLNDSGAKLQVSFAFRPFAKDAPLKLGNLRFAYTQTMFWALNQPSGPFRSTVYSPEVYADIPVGERSVFSLGYRHDSNGRGLPGSVDVNRLFVRAQTTFDLGDDWHVDIAPMAWFYVTDEGVAGRNLRGTWGHNAITAAIRQDNGLKISATARGSFESKRASGELFVSYPMARIGGGFGIYLFGQGFTGYGENLDDIDVKDTHVRFGIALTR